jgi:uncharacterized protein YjdB
MPRPRPIRAGSSLPILLALFTGLTACDAAESPLVIEGAEVSEIRIGPHEAILQEGSEAEFSAVLIDTQGREIPSGPDMPEIVWATRDPSVARFSAPGQVIGAGRGFTTVTATVAGITAEATAIVQPATQGIGFESGEVRFEGIVGLPLGDGVVVRVEDAAGTGVPGVTVRLTARPGSGSVEPELVVTGADGTARVSWVLGRRAGLHRVDAQVPSPPAGTAGPSGESVEANVAAAPPEGREKTPNQKLVGWARPGKPKEVVVTPLVATAEPTDSVQFEAQVRDQHGNEIPDATVSWASRELEVAAIDPESGMADAIADGVAVVDASVEDITGSGTLTVGDGDGTEPGPVETLSITPASWILAGVGDTIRLQAVAKDPEGRIVPDAQIGWSSGSPGIATIDSAGLVTATGIGTSPIVATLICGSSGCDELSATSNGEVEAVYEVTDPMRVSDLRVVGASTGSITLAFTEVDDGAGDPANYALRYGTPVLSWSEAASTEVVIEGWSIGSMREYVYTNLVPGTSYEFQLVAYRGTLGSNPVLGELSNTAAGTSTGVQTGEPVAVIVTPAEATISGVGGVAQLTASALDSEGTTLSDVTFDWTSSNPGIVTVSQEGIITGNALGTALITATVACIASGCSDLPSDDVPVSVQLPPEGLVFHSAWNHEIGSHNDALMDGPGSSTWRWDEFFCSSRHNVLDVVPGSQVAWTRTPHVFRIEHTGRDGDCGAIQERDAVPAQTTHWGRLYFQSDMASWGGAMHNFSYNFVGDIQAVFFRPNGGPDGWRVGFGSDYAPGGVHWSNTNDWNLQTGWLLKTGPGNPTDPADATGRSDPRAIHLPHGEWFRYEWMIEYVTPSSWRLWPRIYGPDGALLYDADDFYPLWHGSESLREWYEAGGAHGYSRAELMRHLGLGTEGRSGGSQAFWYVADFGISLEGWIGSR